MPPCGSGDPQCRLYGYERRLKPSLRAYPSPMLRSAGFSLRNAFGIHAIRFPSEGIVLNIFIQPVVALLVAHHVIMETGLPDLPLNTPCVALDGHCSLHGSKDLAERWALATAEADEQMDMVRHDDEMVYGAACLHTDDVIADGPCFGKNHLI